MNPRFNDSTWISSISFLMKFRIGKIDLTYKTLPRTIRWIEVIYICHFEANSVVQSVDILAVLSKTHGERQSYALFSQCDAWRRGPYPMPLNPKMVIEWDHIQRFNWRDIRFLLDSHFLNQLPKRPWPLLKLFLKTPIPKFFQAIPIWTIVTWLDTTYFTYETHERTSIKLSLTYRCQDTPSGIPSFKSKYAEIRLEAYYSLISFRKAATDSVPFLWTCNGGVEVYFRAVWAYSTHFSPNCREFRLSEPIG